MKTYQCLHCGIDCRSQSSKFNKYCSNYCQREFEYKNRIIEWKETGIIGKPAMKRYLLSQKDGCWECGVIEWNQKPLVLEIEHIDGNGDNNREENLCLLCPNCHSQTPTFKGKNKGNGRHLRRIRYANGQSH